MTDSNGDTGDEIEIEIDADVGLDEIRDESMGAEQSDSRHDDTGGTELDAHNGRPNARDTESDTDGSLADELGRIDLMSTPEGYVEGRVTDLESVDETTVALSVVLPHDVTVTFELEKPIPWSDQFLFARIVEDVGYDAASVGHLVGEPVYVTRSDLEEDDDETSWWTWSLQDVSRYLEWSFGERFRLTEAHGPEWRLVDPLERPGPEPDVGWWSQAAETLDTPVVAATVLVGALAATVGAFMGATGTLALSSTAIVYALPGLALVAIGLAVLVTADR